MRHTRECKLLSAISPFPNFSFNFCFLPETQKVRDPRDTFTVI